MATDIQIRPESKWKQRIVTGLVLFLALPVYAQSDDPSFQELSLETMDEFEGTTANWEIGGDVYMEFGRRLHVEAQSGTGVLINTNQGSSRRDIYTAWEHGDLDLEFEFMMASESNSGIYLQGRYEIQLLDSWGVVNPRSGDMGGIYEMWRDGEGYGGVPPRENATRAPGLWQTMRIQFRAPRFNDLGEKTENARVVEIRLNGVVIHKNVELVGPTRGSMDDLEAVRGPLRIQGDHGPVAFRNIRYRVPEADEYSLTPPENVRRMPLIVNPESEPKVMHGFMRLDSRVYPHTIAVGYPGRVHFAFDTRTSALMKIWKGDFLNMNSMWVNRGGGNLSLNEPAAINLSGAPAFAFLSGSDAAWPDSLQEERTFTFHNYRFGPDGDVTLTYELDSNRIEDRFYAQNGGRELVRELSFERPSPAEELTIRVASGTSITRLPNGLYQADDKSFYIRLEPDSQRQAWIRETENGRELLLGVPAGEEAALSYTYIW
ncbi:MAG: DUF1080 domain-containing protein [Balneolaceae bacterium]